MNQIELNDRPPYYVDADYNPQGEERQSNWNVYSSFIPEKRTWLYDQIEYYAAQECRDVTKKTQLLSTLGMARQYDATCIGLGSVDTIVTHMYVCELLTKALLLFFGVESLSHHGYTLCKDSRLLQSIGDLWCTTPTDSKVKPPIKFGLSQDLHKLFYANSLPDVLPSLKEYLKFCPELIKEVSEIWMEPSFSIQTTEHFGASSLHSVEAHYHSLAVHMPGYTLAGWRDFETKKLEVFPEFATTYTVHHTYSSISAESESKSDYAISTTADLVGISYALGFGLSPVPKQRDIELRYYITFLLGSIGRYQPERWKRLREEEPGMYLMVKRFLDANHLIFPFLVLRYMTGRAYSFPQVAVWS